MENVNLNSIKELVSTQYGDFTGVIQIDGHSNIASIYKLCDDNKFDTNDKFIIGFGLEESTINGVGKSEDVCCRILYVLKEEYGSTFEEIDSKIREDDFLKMKRTSIYVKYSEIGRYIKRYDFLATTALIKSASEIEIEEIEEED